MKAHTLVTTWFTAVILLIPCGLSHRALAESTETPTSASAPVEGRAGASTPADEPEQTELSKILRDSRQRGEGLGSSDRGLRSTLAMLLGYLAVIAILVAAAVFFAKRVFPRMGVMKSAGREIEVVEAAHLAPRRTVFLLRVGSRKLLVGSAREALTNLGDVTDALQEQGQTES
jgi:flagellar biogenesis protein FliO